MRREQIGKPDGRTAINLLDLKPARNLKWESGEKEGVILLVPKFRNRFLVRWLLPRIRRQNFRIKLDKFGSFIWNSCDGSTSVAEIADKMREEYGPSFDPKYERIGKFVSQLVRDKFLSVEFGPGNQR